MLLATSGVAIASGITGCLGNIVGKTGGEELPEVTFRHRYKLSGVGTGGPFVAATEKGIWEEEGLNVSFETSSGSYAAAKSVASGKDKFGNGGVASVMGLREQGQSLVLIGQLYSPMGGVVTTGERGIESWADLEGHTIGEFPYGATGPTAKAAMRKKGVDLSTITFQNVQPGTGYKLLVEGEVDAMIEWVTVDPNRLRQSGYSPTVLRTSNVLNHLGVGLFTRQEVIDDEPETVDKFVRGWLRSYGFFANNIDEVFEIYKPKAIEGYDAELDRMSVPITYAGMAPEESIGKEYGKGWVPPTKVDETVSIFTESGLLEGSVPPTDTYTNEFIDNNRELAVETANDLYDRLEDFDVGPDYI